MRSMKGKLFKLAALVVIGLCVVLFGQTVHAATQSQNVAAMGYTGDGYYRIINGGYLPVSAAAGFGAFTFYPVNRTNLSLAILGPGGVCGAAACDTLILNVASSSGSPYLGLGCNVYANLTTQQKADIVTFVQNGGKVIIYDSECPTQNYSWLPYPFTTQNPGATGSRTGTLTIVEDNDLSSPVAADPQYIDTAITTSGTDAVGDMNVMVTYNANWCLDMSGTNVSHYTGPVHTYARYGNGLIIYNGMDVDYLSYLSQPIATNGPNNLAKIWYQELMVPFAPTPYTALPCGVTVVGITLTPMTATNVIGTSHTVTATLKDLLNNPQPGISVGFTITSGPNAGMTASGVTNASGQTTFTYSSAMAGTDEIQACFYNASAGQTICSQKAVKEWIFATVCDADRDGDIDKYDLSIISRARGQSAPFGDLRDSDGDGIITPNDVKVCIPQCTRPNCAVQ